MANSSKHALYLRDLGALIKEYAQDASEECARHRGGEADLYHAGELTAYGRIISLMQQQAEAFDIALEEMQLDDINVERDLLAQSERRTVNLRDEPQEA